MDRRKALTLLTNGGGLVVAGVVGVPVLSTAVSPAVEAPRQERWRPLGPLDEFPVGTVRQALVGTSDDEGAQSVRVRAVYVWRRAEDEVVVFSRNCTDLSCPVTWDPGSGWFYCPCHGGIFNQEGEPVAGPPKRPLFRYANRVRDGVVEIDLGSLPPMT